MFGKIFITQLRNCVMLVTPLMMSYLSNRKRSDKTPRAGSGVERIHQLRFLARCRKRRLNQVLSVLSLSLIFLACLLCC